jgi:hypothetical protein
MKQTISVGRELLGGDREHREDFSSENFMATFAAIGALLLDARETGSALPDAGAPEEPGARLATPAPLAADEAPGPAVAADEAFLAAFGALAPLPGEAPTNVSVPPREEAPIAPDETADSIATFTAPTPVLSSASVAAAPSHFASSSVTLAAVPSLASDAGLQSSAATPVTLASLGAQPAMSFDMSQAGAPAAVATAHHDVTSSVGGPAVANSASALIDEVAGLVQLATQVAFVPEGLRVGAADAYASFAVAPSFAMAGALGLEIAGEGASAPIAVLSVAPSRIA